MKIYTKESRTIYYKGSRLNIGHFHRFSCCN